MNLLLCSFRDEDRHYSPSCLVEKSSSKHIKRFEGLRITIVENGHEFLHTFL